MGGVVDGLLGKTPKIEPIEQPKPSVQADPDNQNIKKRQQQAAAQRIQQGGRAASVNVGNTVQSKPLGQ